MTNGEVIMYLEALSYQLEPNCHEKIIENMNIDNVIEAVDIAVDTLKKEYTAKQYQKPKSPNDEGYGDYSCPVCGYFMYDGEKPNCCPNCGQLFCWGDKE